MRRNLTVFVMSAALLAWGGSAWAGIQHTVHNLTPGSNTARQFVQTSPTTWAWSNTSAGTADNGNTNEICIYCHTPHQADTSLTTDGVPIWNRQLSSATYTVYSSPTFNATITQPDGVSKACLSCHDGTVGINQLINNKGSGLGTNPANSGDTKITNTPGGGGNNNMAQDSVPYLGTNLSNDHPVSMLFSSARSPNGSYANEQDYGDNAAPGATNSGFYLPGATGGMENTTIYAGGTGGSGDRFGNGIRLFNGKVQCASHHDPHNSANPTFLRVSNDDSKVCRTCHRKDNS